jgi:hypothetical protein
LDHEHAPLTKAVCAHGVALALLPADISALV